ncbi:MAG: 4Fe-4S dicluster domain-containing protein [Sphaerospermopsis sp. SIO1G2]|nr:4Fe-4S dicluster domain-containing protein [Sphaerospermopsis sp. SIO1G1]NET70551.1 4Fe-4S dicluster domain-containing protein [Sphaerospermopsis sp. SIO1G2]
MAYTITSQCISCNLCVSVCPNGAIQEIEGRHVIDSERCTNCADSIYTVPQCKAVCPTANGCVEQLSDYWEMWFATYNRIMAKLTNKQDYWERWYNIYSQKLSEQLKKNQAIV